LQKPENFTFSFDLDTIAAGMGLTPIEAQSFFNDGRIIGRYAEFVVQHRGLGTRALSEGASYDNDTPEGLRLEVRSMCDRVSFASSKEVGYGRKVTAAGWDEKLNAVDLWCIVDYSMFTAWHFMFLTTDEVRQLAANGVLGKNRSISRKKLLQHLTPVESTT
jgi:hypothetical protein